MLALSIVLLIFQYKPAQTWAAHKAAGYLSEKLKTKVNINSLYIKPFSAVVLEGFYVLDKEKDTLVNMPKLTVDINGFSLFKSINQKTLDFSLIQLDNASVYLKKNKDSTSNLKFLIDYFSSPDTSKTKSAPWNLIFEKVAINNMHFRYQNRTVDTVMAQVNFDDIDVKQFSTVVTDMDVTNHLFKGGVHNLTLKEAKSGFDLRNLSGAVTVDTNQILVKNMLIRTPQSNLKNYLHMRFKSFDDFDDFEDKVMMEGDFKEARISSKDIAYFTSGLEKTKFDFGIDGRVTGLVNNLHAKDFTITGGKTTYLKGDFRLKGLPDWDNTFLELNFDQLATTKADIDQIYGGFVGHDVKLPDMLAKFGDIHYTGRFTGLQNDFIVHGTFKTSLGRLDPDINFKFDKNGVPAYTGRISTTNFDLGKMIEVDDLGRATLTANVKGYGDELKILQGQSDARINYITFKGYSYRNVTLNATFKKQVIGAHVTINDHNIGLDLNGTADIGSKKPSYNFAATVTDARLNDLHLTNDTIMLSTQVAANITGDNLKNLQGQIKFTPMSITDPRHRYIMDSLYLAATGLDTSRQIVLRSDFADGSLKGTFDLATFPSYFKTIAKKYIPSLKTTIVKVGDQNFKFDLNIKNVNPLLAMFVPDLKIPDLGELHGQFNSKDQTAVLTGYIKTFSYGKTVFHDLILDEGTAKDYLGLNISLSRINITDSLFIKNISITNFLKRDSLNFNIKLADKNATNQLDLYGLVEFGRDTTAKLKLLPSDLILEHQDWKIQEQVRIRLLDGKTQIQGFELSNGQQKVKINGFISADPADKLKLEFDKFSMVTLDQLTKPAGVHLQGTLNGDATFSAISGEPGADSHLTIDSLAMNGTLVGNVKLNSQLDHDQSLARVSMNILNKGLETMNIGGEYHIGQKGEEDNMDFSVKMDQTEAVIIEPFVSDLVSHIKGHISTNLKLSGPPSNPQFNGDITLANTGLRVNYLKTDYTINDRLTVNNSKIDIKNMTLSDGKKGTATANGSVDLSNLKNPDIEVALNAKNLMALNTTFKDNHLYYGTAYATGDFNFSGPVDNMKIDIKASTEAGTVFNLPLNTSSTVTDYDFITYKSHKDTSNKNAVVKPNFNGVTLNFDLTVDEKTTVKITTDYGKLEGTGTAKNLNLNINSLGDFQMFGDFLITSGKFEFTAKNFISKNFTVNQGGTIRWTGDPANADINLKAIYEVRTYINRLYAAAGLSYPQGNKLVLVQADLILTKSLLLPKIDFDFNFPTDPSIKDDVGNYLSDENNRNQQALSIIVQRNFATNTGGVLAQQALGTAQEAISEFAFNKLNALLAQSNIKYLDLNIRSVNEASASLHFYNDRIVLSGSLFSNTGTNDIFNINDGSLFNSNFSTLTKDFSAQYLIKPNGDLTARYSYRVINTTTLNSLDQLTNQYVNGLGLVYQRDFDTFGEFLRSIFRRGRSTKPVNPAPIPTGTGTPTPAAKPDEDDE